MGGIARDYGKDAEERDQDIKRMKVAKEKLHGLKFQPMQKVIAIQSLRGHGSQNHR